MVTVNALTAALSTKLLVRSKADTSGYVHFARAGMSWGTHNWGIC
jgi:hypothetical protein